MPIEEGDGMRRFTSTGLALLALLAISATVAGTASAAAPKLDLTWLEGTSDLAEASVRWAERHSCAEVCAG